MTEQVYKIKMILRHSSIKHSDNEYIVNSEEEILSTQLTALLELGLKTIKRSGAGLRLTFKRR